MFFVIAILSKWSAPILVYRSKQKNPNYWAHVGPIWFKAKKKKGNTVSA